MARDRADHRRLDVVAAFAAALRGVPAAWKDAWGVLAFASVLIAATALVPLDGWMGQVHAGLMALTSLSAGAALTRVALDRRAGLGAAGLQFGKAEIRIAAALLLNLFFLAAIAGVVALVCLAVCGLAGLEVARVLALDWTAFEPWRQGVLALTALVASAVLVLLIIRLSLFTPASVGRRQIVALNSMGIAAGAFWPLLVLWLVIGGSAALMVLAERSGWVAWPWSRIIAAVVMPWLWAPIAAGALSAAYRQLEYWVPISADTGARSE